ncbi:MAG: hypothetical protein R3C49_17280 [Planctomycetaceae bacterium]
MIRWILGSVLLICSGTSTAAGREIRTLSWSELKAGGQLTAGEIVAVNPSADGGSEELHLSNDSGQAAVFSLATFQPADMTQLQYTVRGHIRYEGVAPAGVLEMWSEFANGSRYFSKTLPRLKLSTNPASRTSSG